MKGVVFNIFQSFVEKNMGDSAWDEILDEVELENDVFVGPETYDDKEFLALVTHTITKFKLVPGEAIRLFGNFAFPALISKVPQFRDQFSTAKEFLEGLDSIIHVEVRKLLPGAETPRFYYKELSANSIELEYESKRNLPTFVVGLIQGLGEAYNEKVDIELISSDDNKHKFKVEFS